MRAKKTQIPFPLTGDRAETPFHERRQQDFLHAMKRRAESIPDHSSAGLLTAYFSEFIALRPDATAENVTGLLLSLALDAWKATNLTAEEVEKRLTAAPERDIEKMFADLSKRSEKRVKERAEMLRACPADTGIRTAYEAARIPAFMGRLLGTHGTTPWDAAHDGHLVSRETARALGIVRWAHAETALRRERLIEAMANTPGFGPGAGRLWLERRPVLFIEKVTVYTAKLAADLWTADPTVGVVITGENLCHNPFEAFGIPLLCDTHGHLRALLGVDRTPVLAEPRLGGFTLTAATGLIDVKRAMQPKRYRLKSAPSWMRTMAEMALIERFDRIGERFPGGLPPEETRARWLMRYRALVRFPVSEVFAGMHSPTTDPRALAAVKAQREAFIPLRNRVLQTLEAAAACGTESLGKEVRE